MNTPDYYICPVFWQSLNLSSSRTLTSVPLLLAKFIYLANFMPPLQAAYKIKYNKKQNIKLLIKIQHY